METIFKLLGVAVVGLMAITGGAVAMTGDLGVAATDAQTFNTYGNGPGGQGTAANATLAQDGSNSPWVTGDERLDMFQDRFDLTDDQIATIQDEVTTMIDDDAAPDEIRSTITDMLADYGVEDPALGPPADGGQSAGPFGQGQGQGNGPADGTGNGTGQGQGSGPHGPDNGSCMN
jgi:hypothetical protein